MSNDVADIIARLETLARARRPADTLLHEFIGAYYREVPTDEVGLDRLDDAYAAVVSHLQLGRTRGPGETVVTVLSPDLERNGWESDRSFLMFVTDDVPFLVDTVRMVLDRHQLGIHLLNPLFQLPVGFFQLLGGFIKNPESLRQRLQVQLPAHSRHGRLGQLLDCIPEWIMK